MRGAYVLQVRSGLAQAHMRQSCRPKRDVAAGISIDRRMHMELAWNRQNAADKAIQHELEQGSAGVVWEVRDLDHLEKIHEFANSKLVVVCMFSRSCGSCKKILRTFEQMCKEDSKVRSGVVYCKHNIVNEFDYASSVANMYKIKHVPSFLIYSNGALIERVVLPDSRAVLYGPPRKMETMLETEMKRVRALIRRHVFRSAPCAQKDC